MTTLHNATGSPLIRDLVADVRAQITERLDHVTREAAALHPRDPQAAARSALLDTMEDLDDHLQIRLATTIAAHNLTDTRRHPHGDGDG